MWTESIYNHEILKWISLITLTLISLRLLTLRYGVIMPTRKTSAEILLTVN